MSDRDEFEEYVRSFNIGVFSFVDWDKTECDLTGGTVYCSDFTRDMFLCYMGGKESGWQQQQQRIDQLQRENRELRVVLKDIRWRADDIAQSLLGATEHSKYMDEWSPPYVNIKTLLSILDKQIAKWVAK
jgi:hypothetical protein